MAGFVKLSTINRSACYHHTKHINAEPQIPEKGEEGIGDPLFPKMGNGGYDAERYDLKLHVHPDRRLDAESTMTAVAEKDLHSFNLDFRGFEVEQVQVNGAEARFEREDGELIITPKEPLEAGERFQVEVDYTGVPRPYRSPHAPVTLGWNWFSDGSYVVSQPDGAHAWYPVNDHPRDRAAYSFEITVPKGVTAVANGVLQQVEEGRDTTTFHWDAEDEMASYLSTVHLGDYVRHEQEGPNGLPIRHYFPSDIAEEAAHDFRRVPEMVEFFSEKFGPYPFKVYGGIVMDTQIGGAALETQTLPLYERGMVTGTGAYETVYVHELGHHWFGDSITLENWQDIWLNEGFATYCQWLWDERNNGSDYIDRIARSTHRRLSFGGGPPVGKPNNQQLFSGRVYQQGALTLHALRRTVGDEDFFETLKTYFGRHQGRTATTEDFVAVANEVSGKNLDEFFRSWLYSKELPDLPDGSPS